MSDLWTSSEIAAATGGLVMGNWAVSGLSIDTRSIQEGELFVPLKDVRDGHDFIPMALEKGAGAVFSEHPIENVPAVKVKDSVAALRDLAIAARERSKAKRIAITGSVGKTSLKEAIARICEADGKTHKSQKSFNNHWGVPLTLASMPKETEYGVFELGMNHAGELADLSPIVSPDICVITKIAPAHLAHFANVDAIAAAKAEIFEGLARGGTAVLNADDDYFEFLSKAARAKGAKIVTFGEAESADFRVTNVEMKNGGISARLTTDDQSYDMNLQMAGRHWAVNGACAVAAAVTAGVPVKRALKALSGLKPMTGRGEAFTASSGGIAFTVIDESYNANPESMRAAIAAMQNRTAGRKIVVLGDMYELGADELRLHADLAGPLVEAGIARVIVTGESMRALRGALPRGMRGAWAQDWESALGALEQELQNGDLVLVKGSNATGLGKLVAKIKEGQR